MIIHLDVSVRVDADLPVESNAEIDAAIASLNALRPRARSTGVASAPAQNGRTHVETERTSVR